MHKYRPVVFTAGGEDGTCGGRHFETRHFPLGGWIVSERGGGSFSAANLGEVRDKIEALVNGGGQ